MCVFVSVYVYSTCQSLKPLKGLCVCLCVVVCVVGLSVCVCVLCSLVPLKGCVCLSVCVSCQSGTS